MTITVEPPGGASGGGLTDAELRATPVDVNITSSTGGGLTDAELRASPINVTTTKSDGEDQHTYIALGSDGIPVAQKEDTGELLTYDVNLERVLGTQPIVNARGAISVEPKVYGLTYKFIIKGTNSIAPISCEGISSVSFQLSGTWGGVIIFEGSINGSDWVSVPCTPISSTSVTPAVTAFSAGIFRCDTTGFKSFRLRFTSYALGEANITLIGSAYTPQSSYVFALGSNSSPVGQLATNEVKTYDTNLATLLPAVSSALVPNADPLAIAPLAPTIATATTAQLRSSTFGNDPSYYPRIRVEVAGDQQIPLSQQMGTNRLMVNDENVYRMLEAILVQLTWNNEILSNGLGTQLPKEYNNIN